MQVARELYGALRDRGVNVDRVECRYCDHVLWLKPLPPLTPTSSPRGLQARAFAQVASGKESYLIHHVKFAAAVLDPLLNHDPPDCCVGRSS